MMAIPWSSLSEVFRFAAILYLFARPSLCGIRIWNFPRQLWLHNRVLIFDWLFMLFVDHWSDSFWGSRLASVSRLSSLVSETRQRVWFERVSIPRPGLNYRIRNREAIKSRRFLSSTFRYVIRFFYYWKTSQTPLHRDKRQEISVFSKKATFTKYRFGIRKIFIRLAKCYVFSQQIQQRHFFNLQW